MVKNFETMRNGQNQLVLDSRYSEAFYMGNIDGSINLPFPNFLNADKTFKSPDEINELFSEATGLNPSDQSTEVVLSCQAGITACILELGL